MGRYIHFQGKKIHYSIHGHGRSVILMHGFAESLDIWKHFTRKLSDVYSVLCIDLPGHGRSDAIHDVHSMELMAESVHEVMNEAGIHSGMIVGHSMGGYVALALAEKYPKKVKGISLFHSHAAADTPEAMVNRDRMIKVIGHDKKGFLHSYMPALFDPQNVDTYKAEILQLKASAAGMSKEAIIASLKGMKVRPDRTHILTNSKSPVQFIIGKNDTRTPMEIIIPQTLLPSYSESIILDGVGHMGIYEARDKTYLAISGFARKVLR